MLSPLLLRTFVAVIDEGGFSRAAARLNLTQSAISGHLQRLEQQLGKTLLKRTTRACELSADGERLISYARAILTLSQDAMAQFSDSPFQGRIRVGLAEDFAQPRLLRVLQGFGARYPAVRIEVRIDIPGQLIAAMKRGEIDLVVGGQCAEQEPGRLLWREPLVWGWAEDQARLELPSPLPLALFPEPCPYRQVVLAQLAQAAIAQRTVMLCSSGASLRAAALSGLAIAPMAASHLTPGLVALKPEQGLPPLPEVAFMLFTSLAGDQQMLGALADQIVECCMAQRREMTASA